VRQVSTTDFDRDPFLLNCQNGTIDLRNGELREHRKDDLISKMIPIDFNRYAKCPQFLRFIHRIMGDGPDATTEERDRAVHLVQYLQRLFGCAATGKAEKLLVILYGSGNNGKSTLLLTVSKALGETEYAAQINIDSLMVDPKGAGTNNAVNSDLSDLRGCRFVFSSEVERGQHLALSRVKYLTGLTSIKARRMRENWTKFPQTGKFFMDCNHRPSISSPTDAIWNRVKCIPFTVTIGADELDTDLPSKLELELPGILAWIVAGACDYVQHGLGEAPAEVEASTAEYHESSNRLREFLEDRVHVDPNAWVSSESLNAAYSDWCDKNGERFPLDSKAFVEQLRSKRFAPKRKEIQRNDARGWQGLELKS
jgi:putative DNA primase/helicase